MTCIVCKQGETVSGTATVTLERGGLILVVRGVPARVCANCGEEYVDEAVAERLLEVAEEASQAGVQVDIREYAAA
jgi:YgiT-type zinc finger domain-containing protein